MSVPRRFNRPQGLKDIDVLIEDDAPVSIYFNIAEVPEVITQGKSSFLIGGSNLLKPEVEIKFEITNDDSGAVIYTEPVPNYLEGTSRRVSIEVYDDVDLFGDATLTVVGELNPLNTNVPTEFLDTYNVRYTRKIYISSAGVNTQPILFFNQPRIVVNEIVKPYITTTIPTGSVTKTGGATGEPIPEDIGATTNVKEIEEPSKFIKKQKNTLNNKMFGGGGNNAFVNKGRRRARRASPDVDKFTITNKSGDKFDARFIGGEIRIPNPQVDTNKFTLESYHEVPTEYKSDVENVKNQDTLVPEKPFTIIDTRFAEDDPQRNVIVPLAPENLTYTASFQPVPTQSISTVNFRSYADIRLSKLRTFSGDVDRIKIYARNKDAFGDFEVISDQQIESPELLFDVFGAGNQRVGYFLNQAHVNEYWVSSSNAVITQDSTYLLNSVEVSGSNKGYNQFITFEQTGSLPITFNKDTEYNISFNALGFVGEKTNIDNSTENIGRAAIFFSGSGFRVNHDFGDDLGFQLEVNDQPAFLNITSGQLQRDFGTITEIFSPQTDGNGVFKFVVFGGRFFISDISINPATSTGFSPNFVQIVAPVPPLTQERPDDYEFIAEFYDVNNNVAESIVFASASTFVGGNSYIAGGDNLLSGSMFIGSSIGGGIEMAGVNSGFIRSIGYEGFTSASNPALGSPGFLMFSGSVLPDSGDDYKGVGLELVGGANSFFKFRTDPSVLDIRTDSFFIGQESIQFMSGSDGNIEISSSLFHLDPKNELLIIGADAVINADLTVNALRTPALINGAPSTILNASSSITSEGFARFVSASIGGFHVSDSEISSSGLLLKSTGQMTGSSTLIGNKSAGQFLQFRDGTLTVQGDITADNIRTPATIGGAPSTDANASSSISSTGFATFKSASIGGFTISTTEISSSGLVLRSSGQLTGSAVSMSGTITADAGRIAGWRIEGSKLSGSNATLDADGAALFKSDQGPGSDTTAAFDQLRNEYYIDFTPADQGNTQNFFVKFGPNFSVDSSGTLFASGAQFEGTISASKGIIGGFTTDEDSLSSTNIFISGSPLAGGNNDPRYMFISTSNFNVKQDGSISGSQVLFDGGKVGGWNINANQLSANNIKINAAVGYIEAGDLNNVSDIGDSSTGFFVNKDGEILLKAGTTANKNYMQFKDGTLDINTDKAHISGSQITLKSPDFFLGDTNNFISGSGGQLKIQALGTTTISGSAVNIQTPKFFMGGVNQFVSGSNGNIEISSSNFHLQPDGDVIMSGTVTAAAGTIGGFAITDTAISSSNDKLILRGDSGQITGSDVLFTAGKIGGWNLTTSGFHDDAGSIQISSTHASMSLGTSQEVVIRGNSNSPYIALQPSVALVDKNYGEVGIFLGVQTATTPKFSVVGTGGHLKFDGTGLDINSDTFNLNASTLAISSVSSGSMALGASPPTTFESGSGFFVDGAGNLLLGSTAGDFLQFGASSGNLVIKSQVFSLFTSTIVIDSSVNNGKVALGASPPTSHTSGNGFYADGTGKFLVGNTSGNFIQFNGTQIIIKAPDFFFGDATNFISGSNGNMSIQSGNFELDANNIEISSTQASMSLGEGKIILQGASTSTIKVADKFLISSDGTDEFLAIGNKTSFTHFDQSTAGIIMGMDDTTTKFEVVGNASNYLSFNGTSFDLKSQTFDLNTSNLRVSSSLGGTIAMGSTVPKDLSSDGIMLSGSGDFNLQGDSNNFLRRVGTDLTIKAETFDLDSTTIVMNSAANSGKIALGNTPPTSVAYTANAGFYVDGTGDFLVRADDNNFIKVYSNTLQLKTETFDLDAGTLIMDSAGGGGNGVIKLGSSASSITETANTGVYIDGNGKFRVGSATSGDNFIHFNGSQIIMKSPDFFLGDSTNFISGSNGDMQIQSRKFELDADNIEISSTHASMSLGEGKIKMIGAGTSTITVGAANAITLSDDGTDRFLVIGSKTSFSHFNQSTAGFIVGTDSGTTKFELVGDSNNYISFDGSQFDIALQQGLELDATNIEISSTNASMSLGEGNILLDGANSRIYVGSNSSKQIEIFGNNSKGYIATGKSSVSDTTEGFWFANNNANPEFHIGDATDFIKLQHGDLDIASQKLEISASTIQISTTQASMSFGHNSSYPQGKLIMEGSGTPTFKMGPDVDIISMTTGSGIYMDGDGNFRFGDDDGHIKFQSGVFSITGSDVNINVDTIDIQTNAFELSSTHASMSLGTNRQWKAFGGDANPYLSIGQSGNGVYGNSGVFLGYNSGGSAPRVSFVGSSGHFKFTGTDLDIKTGTLELDATNIEISSTNASMSLGEGNLLLDGANSKIEVGSANKVTIQGGSTDNFIVLGSKTSFTHFDQSTTGIIMGMDSTVPKFEIAKNSSNYLSFDGTNFDIKLSQGLELDANNIELSSTHASMSLGSDNDINLDGVNKKITIGSANAVTIQGGNTDNFIVMGSKSSFTQFDQSTAGIIMGMDSSTAKMELVGNSSNYISFNGSAFDIKLSQGLELDASNIELSSTHASMSIGNTNPIILQSIGSDRVLRFGNKTDFGQTTTAGFIMGIDNGVPKLDFTVGTSNDNFFRIDSSGVSLQSDNINIDTDRFKITTNAGNERIRFFSGSDSDSGRVTGAGEFVRIGEVSDDASDLYGLKIYDGTGTGSADTLVKLGQDGNEIAGWTITQDRLSGGQMIIRSDGTIESSGFASDVAGSGFRLTAADGGFLEVENAKIRGTMATAVFEKESVNAVGGQLYVANSTTLTGSSFPTALAGGGRTAGDYPANETTMSVENVTGFVQGEILSLKKVTDSGFSTEYVFVNSASRQNPSSETDFSGQLYVTRGYGSGISGDSGSLGDTPSSAQSYSGSQVIVSTGRYISGDAPNTVGSGYIRMNANPADPTTPYIDIIERTGSGIYDVSLKARLGDLSGLSSGLLYGETNPGFGLFTENVFLQGGITATTGSITGKLFVDTSSSQKMIFGIGVDGGSNDGIFINANNYWYTNGVFKVGSATYNIQHDSSGNISITPKTFELDAPNLEISSANASMSLGEGNILLDGVNNKIKVGAHSANNVEIVGSNTQGYIRTGKTSVTDTTSGFWLANNNSDPEFSVGSATNFLKYDGGTLSIETQQLELAANTDDLQISSTQKSMSLAAGNVLLDGGGNVGYVRIGSNSTYDRNINISGSSTQAIIKAGKTSFTDTTNAGFVLEKTNTDSRFFVGDASSVNFIKFDTSDGVQIQTQKFELAANTDDLQISATQKSMSLAGGNVLLDGAQTTGYIRVGSATQRNNNINISGSNTLAVIKAGFTGSYADGTAAGDNGFILERNLTSTKFHVGSGTEYIRFDGTNIDISAANFSVTASDVNIAAGNSISIDTPDFELSSTQKSMSLGYDTNGDVGINIVGGDPSTIFFGSKTSPPLKLVADDQAGINEYYLATNNKSFGDTTAGVIIGSDAGVQKLELFKDAGEKLTYSSTDGFDVKTSKLTLGTAGLTISGSETTAGDNKILLGSATSVDAGEGFFVDGAGNFRVGDATSGGSNFLKFTSGGSLQIKSDNIDITSTAFELVANTDDLQISSTHKSMSFAGQKIVIEGSSTNGSLKIGGVSSVTDTTGANKGFYAEGDGDFIAKAGANKYIQFNGGDLDVKTDKLQIDTSDFEVSSTEASMSLGEGKIKLIGASTSTITVGSSNSITISDDGTDRFVTVGKSNFGQFDQSTEGIIFGTDNGDAKFEVVADSSNYISFDGNANTLDIKASQFNLTGTSGLISLGTLANADDVGDSSTGFRVDSSGNTLIKQGTANTGYIRFASGSVVMKTSDFFLGDSTNHLSGSNGNLNIKSVNFELDAGDLEISSANVSMSLGEGKIKLVGGSTSKITVADKFKIQSDGTDEFLAIGSKGNFTHFNQSTAGIIMGMDDTTTKFEVVGNASNYISFNGSAFDIKSETFGLNAGSLIISSSMDSGNGVIRLGSGGGPSTPTADVAGIYMDGGGALNVYGDASNYLRFDGGSVDIRTDEILIQTAGTNKLKLSADGSNTPTFAMGATLNTSVAGTNKGIFMNGEGDFLLRGNESNFFKFDASGNTIEIKSDTFDLDASTIIMDSSGTGKIALGASPPSAHTSGTGFYVDGDGNLLLGSTGGSFIQYAASSGHITINSQIFNLFTSTLVIDSSTNNGKIALGATPNSSVGGTNKGVYMDGTGDFLVRGGPDNFLKFDAGGNTLEIKSDTFDLATNNLIVDSGTNSGKIALGATSTIPSAYNNGTGFYADGTGKFKVGNSEANNINFDGTNLNISSSIFLSGSMTVGTADSGSAQPDSFISVGKPSSPHDDSGGIEIRKDYFCDFRTTHGIIHVDLVASSTSGFGNPCNGQGTGTNDYGGPEGTADNCPARTMPANNALSLIYVMGQANNGSPDDSTGTGVDASYGGSSDYFNPEIDKDNQHLLMRLVVWANATSDGGPTGQYKSGDNFTGMSGVHTGLAAGHYIGIGKGFFTEIAYIVERQTIGHQSVGKDETEDPFKGGVPYWSGGADVAKSGTARTGVAVPPNTTNVGSYYQYLSMSGYTVFRVARDCFNRGIRYENKADTPSLNPEDYVEIASLDSDGKPANDGTEAAYYLPAPTVQPHLNHTWAGAPVPHDINYDQWRDSGRKVVVFLTTPKPIPIMTVGEQGKILAVDKDVSGIVGGEVGWKLYSEFATERSAGVGSYESGLGQLDVT